MWKFYEYGETINNILFKKALRGKCIAINDYTKKEKRFQINSLTFHFKELEKEEKVNPNPPEGRK